MMNSWTLLVAVVCTVHIVSAQDCPVSDGMCNCILENPEYGDLINCSFRGLTDIPAFDSTNQTWDTLLLDGNNLGVIAASAFNGLSVGRIKAEEAGVTGIEEGAFTGLEDILTELDLTDNSLTQDTIIAIRDLPVLTLLNLDYNDISTLNESHFINLPSITQLSLQFNEFTSIFPEYVANVPTLTEYDLYGNRITFVHNDSFSSLTQLLQLDLGINDLPTIPTYSFRDLAVLEHLSLWANDFTEITTESLSTVSDTLEILYLGQNDVPSLPEDLFNQFPNLDSLFLEIMLLDDLPDNLFANQQQLRYLAISDNNFDHVPTAIENLPLLYYFYESGNQLTSINGDEFLNNLELAILDVSENEITFVNQSLFCNNPELYIVDLAQNNIELFESCAAIIRGSGSDLRITLDNNPLFCGCDILWLYERDMIFNPQTTTCAQPEALAGRPLTEITPEEFQCDLNFLEECLGVCI